MVKVVEGLYEVGLVIWLIEKLRGVVVARFAVAKQFVKFTIPLLLLTEHVAYIEEDNIVRVILFPIIT